MIGMFKQTFSHRDFHFVTKCPWGFVLSVTVRGNAFIAKQNRLSATARVFRTFAEVLGAGPF